MGMSEFTIVAQADDVRITLFLKGKLSMLGCPKLQEAIFDAFTQAKNVTLDLTKLIYISSAGLRVLLIGQKEAMARKLEMEVVGPAPVVMSVFETTGFTKVLTIRPTL
jgi:anti-anti-sigma factor